MPGTLAESRDIIVKKRVFCFLDFFGTSGGGDIKREIKENAYKIAGCCLGRKQT